MPSAEKKPTKSLVADKPRKSDIGPERFDVPLNVTCDMAWRIASTYPEFQKMVSKVMEREESSFCEKPEESALENDGETLESSLMRIWKASMELAYRFTTSGRYISGVNAMLASESARRHQDWVDAAVSSVDIPGLTLSERENMRVTFRRGCKLVTGLLDGPDAERSFERNLPMITQRAEDIMPLEHYREIGFSLLHLGVIREAWLKLPKEKLRKKYEKSGRYRRNKQGRPRNPKK